MIRVNLCHLYHLWSILLRLCVNVILQHHAVQENVNPKIEDCLLLQIFFSCLDFPVHFSEAQDITPKHSASGVGDDI
jgi:hypothetical protein